jgi:hypothetical protein
MSKIVINGTTHYLDAPAKTYVFAGSVRLKVLSEIK